jgi:hypothetical protein
MFCSRSAALWTLQVCCGSFQLFFCRKKVVFWTSCWFFRSSKIGLKIRPPYFFSRKENPLLSMYRELAQIFCVFDFFLVSVSRLIRFACFLCLTQSVLFRICIISRGSKALALRALNRLRFDEFNLAECAPYPYSSYHARGLCLYTATRLINGNAHLLTGLVAVHLSVPSKRFLNWKHFLMNPLCELIKTRAPHLQYLSLDVAPSVKLDRLSELWDVIKTTPFPRMTDFKIKFPSIGLLESLEPLKGMPRLTRFLHAAWLAGEPEDAGAFLRTLSSLAPRLTSLKMVWNSSLGDEAAGWSFASLFPNLRYLRFFSRSDRQLDPKWLNQLHFLPKEVGPNLIVRWETFWFALTDLKSIPGFDTKPKPKEILNRLISEGFDPRRHDSTPDI